MTVRLVVGALLLAGCVDESAFDEGTVSDGKADGIAEFKLKLNSTQSGMRAKESPKLPGAPATTAKFTCPIDDRTTDGWRLVCERGQEQLALTWGPGELEGAAIYRKSKLLPDAKSFYHCEAASAGANSWPTELSCEAKTPKGMVGGQMVSPFSSSIELGIANSHLVAEGNGAKLFRGMKPFRPADFTDLEALEVGAVLIFKKPTSATEVSKEIAALTPIGVPETKIVNIPFGYKDFTDFATPCRMTVQGLAKLVEWRDAGTNAFMHCTVGEDRTGYLAGLYRLLTETAEVEDVFESELCERGYSAGNPQKPFAGVAKEIDADLTPVFLKMAHKIKTGELTETSLDESVCDVDPEGDPAFTLDPEMFRCSISTRYRL